MEINLTNATLILVGVTIPMVVLYFLDKDFEFACFGIYGYLIGSFVDDLKKSKFKRFPLKFGLSEK